MNQMNERVEELAKEAGMTICELGFPNISEFNIEKFAQLIVRECADICCNIDDKHGEDDSIAYWAAKDMLEHFGLIDE